MAPRWPTAGIALVLLVAPLAGAAHNPPSIWDSILSFEREGAGFELAATDSDNRNGPAVDDTRAIPAEPEVPARFIGLADTLAAPASYEGRGQLITDHRVRSSLVVSGHAAPYHSYVGNALGSSSTPPTSAHSLWHGYWDDVNADGVIDDDWCAHGRWCGPTDEFVWRGANTGEDLAALLWLLPGDASGKASFASLAADGAAPDAEYDDMTEPYSRWQGWRIHGGAGRVTAEEFLLVTQHSVSIIGPESLRETGPYGYQVECALADGCMRDYDYHDALADDTAEALYLEATRAVRDAVGLACLLESPLAACIPDVEGGIPEASR